MFEDDYAGVAEMLDPLHRGGIDAQRRDHRDGDAAVRDQQHDFLGRDCAKRALEARDRFGIGFAAGETRIGSNSSQRS